MYVFKVARKNLIAKIFIRFFFYDIPTTKLKLKIKLTITIKIEMLT